MPVTFEPADNYRDEYGNRAIRMDGNRVTYRGLTIAEKTDFGPHGYRIHGFQVKHGYVVTDGGLLNMMPGATFFLTVEDAMIGIDDLITAQKLVKADAHFTDEHPFWKLNRFRHNAEQRAAELAMTLDVLLTAIEDSIDRPISVMNRLITARQHGKKLVDQINDNCDTRTRRGPPGGPYTREGPPTAGRFGILPLPQEGAAQ